MSLGKRIRSRRQELGFSMRELGAKARLSISFLCDVERDRRRIGADNLFALSQVLGVSIDWLMGGNARAQEGEGLPLNLPASLIRFAGFADLPFQQVLCLYRLMEIVMDHRLAPGRQRLEDVDWLKFHKAVKDWLEPGPAQPAETSRASESATRPRRRGYHPRPLTSEGASP
jgi:transcriptional regulator with XRE-family HTH domain